MKTALDLAREWDIIFSLLTQSTIATGSNIVAMKLKPEYAYLHPFYAGKLSLLNYLRELNDEELRLLLKDAENADQEAQP